MSENPLFTDTIFSPVQTESTNGTGQNGHSRHEMQVDPVVAESERLIKQIEHLQLIQEIQNSIAEWRTIVIARQGVDTGVFLAQTALLLKEKLGLKPESLGILTQDGIGSLYTTTANGLQGMNNPINAEQDPWTTREMTVEGRKGIVVPIPSTGDQPNNYEIPFHLPPCGYVIFQDEIPDTQLVHGILEQILPQVEQDLVCVASMENVEKLATVDSLTGLLNRRSTEKNGNAMIEHALRENRAMSVLMLDIDNFKSYNDTYGHQMGDRAIELVARTINTLCRKYDLAGRYGGEEFILILPEEQAAELAERIRSTVVQLPGLVIPDTNGEQTRQITVSIGCFSAEPNEYTHLNSLVNCADRHLYESKAAGRNTITWETIGGEIFQLCHEDGIPRFLRLEASE